MSVGIKLEAYMFAGRLAGRTTGWNLHAVSTVGPHHILAINPARNYSNIQVMFRTSMVVWTATQGGHGHLIHVRSTCRFFH